LYPALLLLAARLGWRRTMVILAGCELLIRGLDGMTRTVGATDTVGGHIASLLAISPLGYWFSWALGAFIADAFLKNQQLPFIKTSPILWLGLAIVSYFVKPLDSFLFLLFAVTTAVVASKLLSGTCKITIPAFLSGMLRKFGLWSYSIYLLHQPLIGFSFFVITVFFSGEHFSLPIRLLLGGVTWLAVIPFSVLWFKLFERPSIALGKRIIENITARRGPKVGLER
jgi:peptidoglycan/LPS O-acetylase OafA/YrhL